jgi:DnaJ-class molecular chaperone with C-terminal Zn finger domain
LNNGLCTCPTDSTIVNNTCICSQSYFIDCLPNCLSPTSYFCNSCHKTCGTCKSAGINDCLTCAGYLSFSSSGTCSICPNRMFFDGSTCQNCSSDCSDCSSKDFCLTCSDSSKTANSLGQCATSCLNGYHLSGTTCLPCPNLCVQCNFGCSKCADNASLNSYNGACYCNQGYNQTSNTCSPAYFSANLQLNYQNTVKLQFSDPISANLTIANFSISIQDVSQFSCSVI